MLYVDAAFSMLNIVEDSHSDLIGLLRELTGKKMRRVDRYTLLALAGAMQCGDRSLVKPEAALVLATQTGTLSTTIEMMHKIGVEKQPPKPFQFVNSLGNSACFSLARLLDINGPSLAVSSEQFSFESGLDHAELLVAQGLSQIMVGGLDEAPLPISDHLRRHLDEEAEGFFACYEGSHWLRLSSNKTSHSIAAINLLGQTQYSPDIKRALRSIQQQRECDTHQPDLVNEDCVIFGNGDFAEYGKPKQGVLVHGTYSGHCFVQASKYVEQHTGSIALVATSDLNKSRIHFAEVRSIN